MSEKIRFKWLTWFLFFFFNLYPIFIWGLSVSPMQTEEREFSAKNIPSIISN